MGDAVMGVSDLLGIESWLNTPEKKCSRLPYFPLLSVSPRKSECLHLSLSCFTKFEIVPLMKIGPFQ